jgi:hypothetical protein
MQGRDAVAGRKDHMAATAVEERNMALVVFAFLLGLRMSKGVLFWMRIEAVVEKKN